MGPVDELAKAQRDRLKKKMLSTGLPGGALFGLFTGFFGYFGQFKGYGLIFISILALLQGVFFGFFQGWYISFIWPERRLSLTQEVYSGSESNEDFVVQYSKWMICVSGILMVFFIAGGFYSVFGVIEGILDESHNKFFIFPWWLCFLLGVFCIFDFYLVRLGSRKYKVSGDGVYVKEILGRKKVFTWNNLKRVGLIGDRRAWLPYYLKRVKYAEFENENHKSRKIFIYPDMINADRLFVLMDNKINM